MQNKVLTLSKFLQEAPQRDHVVAYSSKRLPIYRSTLIADVADLQDRLTSTGCRQVSLWTADIYSFLVGLLGAIAAGCDTTLPANLQHGRLRDSDVRSQTILSTQREAIAPGFMPILDQAKAAPAARDRPVALSIEGLKPSLILQTSGSTGRPTAVVKSLASLETEVAALERTLPLGQTTVVASTVAPFHVYGLLFQILWPLCSGRPILCNSVQFPENLLMELKAHGSLALVASPAFLTRILPLIDSMSGLDRLDRVFSSGGALPAEVAAVYARHLQKPIAEIFGSTETGGVAYRMVTRTEPRTPWKPFDGISVHLEEEGRLEVHSPYLEEPFTMGDLAEILPDGTFHLRGRADRIVKVEEKRVSLAEMEQVLKESQYVQDVRACLLKADKRTQVAVVVALTRAGRMQLRQEGKNAFKKGLRTRLLNRFEPVTLPRKWRFVNRLPVNSQGKIQMAEVESLFLPAQDRFVTRPDILEVEKQDNSVQLTLSIPENLGYFKGHFKGVPILAGVVQLDWAIRFGQERFPEIGAFLRLEAVKFHSIIRPDIRLTLKLTHVSETNKLKFSYHAIPNGDSELEYSSGRIVFGRLP